MITDKTRAKWVNTNILGLTSLVLLKDVGAPIVVIRTRQEDQMSGLAGKIIFEYELPLNFKVEKLSAKFTAISLLDQGQYLGLYF